MYKLLLVDDDSAFLEQFHQLVDWGKYNFEVVEKVYDGEEAIDYISKNAVDAVITDVRMPEISGIELARFIKSNYPQIKVVFFSAFRDFKYAKEGMKYAVIDYINKPIYDDQIEEAFSRLKEVLDERDNDSNGKIIDYKVLESREELFCRLIGNVQISNDYVKDELESLGIAYRSLYQQCILAIFDIEGIDEHIKNKWKNDAKNFYEAISKVVCEETADYYTIRLSFADNKIVLLYLNKSGNGALTNGMSITAKNLKEIFDLEVVGTEFLSFDTINDLKMMSEDGNKPVLKYLKTVLEQKKDSEILNMVTSYVNEHYAEDISLDSLAKQYHFGYTHFSRLFKNIVGESFIDYLTRVRIEKAKELLSSGMENTDEIYAKVGYTSSRHFNRVFSLHTGCTPTQYSKKMLNL